MSVLKLFVANVYRRICERRSPTVESFVEALRRIASDRP